MVDQRPDYQQRCVQIELQRERRGARDLSLRLADVDRDGVDAELVFPSMGLMLPRIADREGQREACKVWVRGPVPSDVHELVHTDVPVLLLSGGRDAVTPPAFAERAAKYMANSLQVVFPESSHGNFGACGDKIQAEFFERGLVKGLDVSCAAAQKPTKFVMQ